MQVATLPLTQGQKFALLIEEFKSNKLTQEIVQESFDDGSIGAVQYARLMLKLDKQSEITDTEALKHFQSSCSNPPPYIKFVPVNH